MLKIKDELRLELLCSVEKSPDKELCGVLWFDQTKVVAHHSAYPGELSQRSFQICERWMLHEFYGARRQGRSFAAYYHSHPEGSSLEPSRRDWLGHPPLSRMVLLGDGEIRAYLREEERARFSPLKLVWV